jgi:hypothetical protein
VFAIGRLYYAYLASDERYYLRLLLSTVKGCTSYKDIRTVTSCGIAALLLDSGRTTHSQFHIQLNTTDQSTCDIKQSTYLASLLNKTSLILWDEAPMAHRNCFEALDKRLQDLLRCRYNKAIKSVSVG